MFCFAVMSKQPVTSFVGALLKASFPSAIIGGIVRIIVNPSDCIPVRNRPHILGKQFKRTPAITDFYAAQAVILPRVRVWISTSLVHVVPSDVDFRLATLCGASICDSHVIAPMMALVRGPETFARLSGFAILA